MVVSTIINNEIPTYQVDRLTRLDHSFKIHTYSHFFPQNSGHCKKLAPEYEGAAEILAKNDPPISLGKVDATVEKTLAERFGI